MGKSEGGGQGEDWVKGGQRAHQGAASAREGTNHAGSREPRMGDEASGLELGAAPASARPAMGGVDPPSGRRRRDRRHLGGHQPTPRSPRRGLLRTLCQDPR